MNVRLIPVIGLVFVSYIAGRVDITWVRWGIMLPIAVLAAVWLLGIDETRHGGRRSLTEAEKIIRRTYERGRERDTHE